MKITQIWNENEYKKANINAQRLFPNEELIRSLGRNGFLKENGEVKKFLELGCGTGSNLLPLNQFNIVPHGIDLSKTAIDIAKNRLGLKQNNEQFIVGSMELLSWPNNYFDFVFDVFSSCCLLQSQFSNCLAEIKRVLKPNGIFFIYTPSSESDAFKNHKPAKLLEEKTLNGIYRNTSPFSGNHYPMRFESVNSLSGQIRKNKFKLNYLETLTRTYSNLEEKFQFLVAEAEKYE